MKLNLEIEIDWIDEEKGVDELVEQKIIDAVTNKVQKLISDKIETKVNAIVDELVVDNINKKTDELFKGFINRPVSLTDNYGSTIKVYETVEALIKERFDTFLTQPVDENGKATERDRYGKNFQRLEFIIDKQLKDFANTFTTDAVKKVSEEIKNHVKEGLTTKLGAELMKVLKVNEMLEIGNGK